MVLKQYEAEQRRAKEERDELEKLKKMSLQKPLAEYAPATSSRSKQTTIQKITKEAHANIMGIVDKIEKQKQP
jgi:hypothetical protein